MARSAFLREYEFVEFFDRFQTLLEVSLKQCACPVYDRQCRLEYGAEAQDLLEQKRSNLPVHFSDCPFESFQ